MTSSTGSRATAAASGGRFCGSRLREYRRTSSPRLYASSRMPSNFRSNSQLPPLNRSCVSVAAIGSSQSGMSVAEAIGSEEDTAMTVFDRRLRNGYWGVCSVMLSSTDVSRVVTFAGYLMMQALAAAQPVAAAQAVAPPPMPVARPGQQLNPPYLAGMPSPDVVRQKIQGSNPVDTLARQVAVLNRLPRIISDRMRLAPERGFNLTPDE